MALSDRDLLDQYARDGSQAAFGELVRRHLDLVYSAAQRHVHSAALAEEVAQSVFLDLSRHASQLKSGTPLVAWLHLVTRRTAIDVIRAESRRAAREQTALEISAVDSSPSPWLQIEPLLDEAVESLPPADRNAVLLRYFENKSLREVGESLGTSDDTAQKRVSRAIEELRKILTKRGVVVTGTGLATTLSAHAIQAAPASLCATISSAVVSVGAAVLRDTAVAQAAHSLAMTTVQKILVTTTLTIALGGGLFEARVISRQNAELRDLHVRAAQLERELDSTRAERAARARAYSDAQDELQKLRAKAAAYASADPAIEAALDTWLQNVVRLKQCLEKNPASQIPELRFLTAKDWLDATKEASLDTDLDVRRALSNLRRTAKEHFSQQLSSSLKGYLQANHQTPPTDGAQLTPYLKNPADADILQRYGMVPFNDSDHPRIKTEDGFAKWFFQEKRTVDDYYDSTLSVAEGGSSVVTQQTKFAKEVYAAIQSFKSANNSDPTNPSQLAAYLHSTIDPAFIQRRLDNKY